MKLIQRSEHLFEVPMGFVKAFLIRGNNELALIDTGVPGMEMSIIKAIDDAGLDSSVLKHILITHLHFDHVGSLFKLKELTGARVYIHEDEAEAVERGIIMRTCTPAPTLVSRIAVPLISSAKRQEKRIEGTRADKLLHDDDRLDIAGGIRVVHTPGHTIGHVSYLIENEDGILITGDAASGGRNPGYPMLFEDKETGLKSLHRLGELNFTRAYFSHGKGIIEDPAGKFKKRF